MEGKLVARYNSFLNSLGKNLVFRMIKILKLKNKFASGALINSIDYQLGGGMGKKIISMLAEDYLVDIDQGTPPGKKVPLSDLRRWAQFKHIPQSRVPAIQKSIYKKGIKPVPVIDDVISSIEKDFKKEMEDKFSSQYEIELSEQLKINLKLS